MHHPQILVKRNKRCLFVIFFADLHCKFHTFWKHEHIKSKVRFYFGANFENGAYFHDEPFFDGSCPVSRLFPSFNALHDKLLSLKGMFIHVSEFARWDVFSMSNVFILNIEYLYVKSKISPIGLENDYFFIDAALSNHKFKFVMEVGRVLNLCSFEYLLQRRHAHCAVFLHFGHIQIYMLTFHIYLRLRRFILNNRRALSRL